MSRPFRWWTDEERAIVREHYPLGGWKACVPLLAGRNEDQIRKQAQRLEAATRNLPPGFAQQEAEQKAAIGDALRAWRYPVERGAQLRWAA